MQSQMNTTRCRCALEILVSIFCRSFQRGVPYVTTRNSKTNISLDPRIYLVLEYPMPLSSTCSQMNLSMCFSVSGGSNLESSYSWLTNRPQRLCSFLLLTGNLGPGLCESRPINDPAHGHLLRLITSLSHPDTLFR